MKWSQLSLPACLSRFSGAEDTKHLLCLVSAGCTSAAIVFQCIESQSVGRVVPKCEYDTQSNEVCIVSLNAADY